MAAASCFRGLPEPLATRHEPVVAVVVVQVHVAAVEVQVVGVGAIAWVGRRRPVVAVGARVVQRAIVVVALGRQEACGLMEAAVVDETPGRTGPSMPLVRGPWTLCRGCADGGALERPDGLGC